MNGRRCSDEDVCTVVVVVVEMMANLLGKAAYAF
jgi:hypothetical protein